MSKTSEESRLYALCHLLNEHGLQMLKTRISCVYDPESYISAMEVEKATLTKVLPLAVLKNIYGEPEEKPSQLDSLSLRSTIVLCFVLPKLKGHFREDEKDALTMLNKTLLNLFNNVYRMEHSDQLSHVIIDDLFADVVGILSKLGLNEKNVKEELDEIAKTVENDKVDRSLIEDMEKDEMAMAVHLKMIEAEIREKQAYNEILPKWLEELAEQINKLHVHNQLDLDGFVNLRKSLKSSLLSLLNCAFCSETAKEPRTFPCLHTFCLACIKTNVTDKVVTCPSCCTRVAVGEGSKIDELPVSFVISSLMQLLTTCEKEEGPMVECKSCIETPVSFCLTCIDLFCRNHSVLFFHENHIVAPLSEMINCQFLLSLAHKFCPQHSKELVQFCPTCCIPLCATPICVTWHGQHSGGVAKLVNLKDTFAEQRQKTTDLNEILKTKAERIDVRIQAIEQNQVDVASVQENIRESIVHFFDDISAALEKAKDAYLTDLDKSSDHCMHSDEQTRQVLQHWKLKSKGLAAKLDEFCQDLDACNKFASITELMGLKNRILAHLADTAGGATITDSKSISYPESNLRNVLQEVNSLKSQLCPVVHSRGWETVLKAPGAKYFMVNKNQLYVIKRQLLTGVQLMQYDLKNMDKDPVLFCDSNIHDFQAVAFDDQGNLCIPEEVQNNLELPSFRMKRFVNLSRYKLSREKVGDVRLEFLNDYAKILFKSAGQFQYIADDSCVCEMKPNGELFRKFNFVNMIKLGDFAVDHLHDMLFLTENEKHSLMIFDCKRQSMITIGEQGVGVTPDNFNCPTGVTLDGYGHLFVADSGNARIQVFEISGRFVKLIQYPLTLKDTIIESGATSRANTRTIVQAHENYLYMLDSNSDTIWRLKYF